MSWKSLGLRNRRHLQKLASLAVSFAGETSGLTDGIQGIGVQQDRWAVFLKDEQFSLPPLNMRVSSRLDFVKNSGISSIRVSIRSPQRLTGCSFNDEPRSPDELLLEIHYAVTNSPRIDSAITIDPNVIAVAIGENIVAHHAVECSINAGGNLSVDNTRGNFRIISGRLIGGKRTERIGNMELKLVTEIKGLDLLINGCGILGCHQFGYSQPR